MVHLWEPLYKYRFQGRSLCAVNREYCRIKTFLSFMAEQGYVDWLEHMKLPMPKVPRSLPKALTVVQVDRVLEAALRIDYRAYAAFMAFLYTGMRRGDLLSLREGHVNLPGRRIAIIGGKGGKDRVVPICPRLALVLKRWSEVRPFHPKYFNMSEVTLRRIKKRIQDSLPFDFTIHMLRHTFATQFLKSTKDIESLRRVLGHSDLKTTLIYTHLDTDYITEQMAGFSY